MNFDLASYMTKAQNAVPQNPVVVNIPEVSPAIMHGDIQGEIILESLLDVHSTLIGLMDSYAGDKPMSTMAVENIIDQMNYAANGVMEFSLESFGLTPTSPMMLDTNRLKEIANRVIEKIILVIRQLIANLGEFFAGLFNTAERRIKMLKKLESTIIAGDSAYMAALPVSSDTMPFMGDPSIVKAVMKGGMPMMPPSMILETVVPFTNKYDSAARLKGAAEIVETYATATDAKTVDDAIDKFTARMTDIYPFSVKTKVLGREAWYYSILPSPDYDRGFVAITSKGRQTANIYIEVKATPDIFEIRGEMTGKEVLALIQAAIHMYEQFAGDARKDLDVFKQGMEETLETIAKQQTPDKDNPIMQAQLNEAARLGKFLLQFFRVERQYMFRIANGLTALCNSIKK